MCWAILWLNNNGRFGYQVVMSGVERNKSKRWCLWMVIMTWLLSLVWLACFYYTSLFHRLKLKPESWWKRSAIANSAHLSVYLVVKMLKIGKIVSQFVVAERWSPQVMFAEKMKLTSKWNLNIVELLLPWSWSGNSNSVDSWLILSNIW